MNAPYIHVLSEADGCRYKLVLKAGLERLTVHKIKKHLFKASGIPVDVQKLYLGHDLLREDALISSTLRNGDVLHLCSTHSSSSPSSSSPPVAAKRAPSLSTAADLTESHSGTRNGEEWQANSAHTTPAETAAAGRDDRDGAKDDKQVYRSLFVDDTQYSSHHCIGSASPSRSTPSQSAPTSSSPGQKGILRGAAAEEEPSTYPTPHGLHRDNSRHPSLAEEIVVLREKVHQLEQQCAIAKQEAANATSDWKLEEEVDQLRQALVQCEQEKEMALNHLNAKWQLKENDLVRELDRCREERRRLREEREAFEREQFQKRTAMEVELRLTRKELHEKDDLVQHLRVELATLQSRLNPQVDDDDDDDEDDHRDHGRMGRNRILRAKGKRAMRREEELGRLSTSIPCRSAQCFDELVEDSLEAIGRVLRLTEPIQLSDHYTAVVEVESPGLQSAAGEQDRSTATCSSFSSSSSAAAAAVPRRPYTLLITVDPSAERLFLYATLLNRLPSREEDQRRLYEMLLEAALLGREVAGGGVGISREDRLVLLSTTVDLRYSDSEAMAVKVLPFVEAVARWSERLEECFPVSGSNSSPSHYRD